LDIHQDEHHFNKGKRCSSRIVKQQLDSTPMRRLTSERTSKSLEVDGVDLLERRFAFRVLLDVVIPAQAYAPSIGRLEGRSTIRSTTNVSAFDVS
jgi:hypothetical protein